MSKSGSATATRERKRHPHAIGQMTDGRRLRATYDAAQSNHENQNHWAAADALSANSANNPAVRAVLRFRARYEFANNTYCQGMLLTVANDIVGSGPTLHINHRDRKASDEMEAKWESWFIATCLADKLWTAVLSDWREGEGFLHEINNPALRHKVKLDYETLEADMVATPTFGFNPQQLTDGILFDRYGNPKTYHVLRVHPGEQNLLAIGSMLDYVEVPADAMIHMFRCDRAGQKRGIPRITPSLMLYALLRRYTLAVVSAAETAADLAAIIKSSFPPDEGDDATYLEPNDIVDIVRRAMMVLPEGYDIHQFDAKQPTTTYPEFKHELICEIARCLNMPFNIAAGNSQKYNYASGRLDHKLYYKMVRIEQKRLERRVLERIFAAWLREATLIPGYLPIPDADTSIPHQWSWPGDEHVDPEKEANADETRLNNRTLSYSRYYASKNLDWREEFEQIAEEQAAMNELGIEPEFIQHNGRQSAIDPQQMQDDGEEAEQ